MGGEQEHPFECHFKGMKYELVQHKTTGPIKPGTPAAVAMICGFWTSQSLAAYFVAGSMGGSDSKAVALSLVVFTLFFLLHVFGPWSKLAAILGVSSVGVMVALVMYLHAPVYDMRIPSTGSLLLLSAGLSFAGVMLDAEKYRHWVASQPSDPLKLNNPSLRETRQAVCPNHYKQL